MILHPCSIVRQKEYYRLFTADLVHNDVLHLALNEIMLFVFCSRLEAFTGSAKFVFVYFLSYFAGVVITTVRHRNQFKFSSAGLPGALWDVCSALLFYSLKRSRSMRRFSAG